MTNNYNSNFQNSSSYDEQLLKWYLSTKEQGKNPFKIGWGNSQTNPTNNFTPSKIDIENSISRLKINGLLVNIIEYAKKTLKFFPLEVAIEFGENEFLMGNYRLVGANEKEPLEWVIVKEKDGDVFAISKYCVDIQPFHDKGGAVPWRKCSLRKWLNVDFYNRAFSSQEQMRIKPTKIRTPYGENLVDLISDGKTTDKLFIPDYTDLHDLYAPGQPFYKDAERKFPVIYENKRHEKPIDGYWVRNIDSNSDVLTLWTCGNCANEYGFKRHYMKSDCEYFVRPAMWVKL